MECGEPVVYVATATGDDDEMAARIALHRAGRPPAWRTVEAPLGIMQQLSDEHRDGATVLVEDLTLLLANLMAEDERGAEARALAEVNALLALAANVVLVSNEVGMGIVPPYPLGRVFRDALGRLNQSVAAACGEVYLLVAGLPLQLK
jgi:adenosylcobinamide kinase/adenosylcobinamide-phosphate guanylyltransferase